MRYDLMEAAARKEAGPGFLFLFAAVAAAIGIGLLVRAARNDQMTPDERAGQHPTQLGSDIMGRNPALGRGVGCLAIVIAIVALVLALVKLS
ncbi:hypothetical protein Dvina_17410 [Dactylosporangium vinaceum]|uniref:Uncharacterized protein n=1 Tax=Dactylosporangium vinaceum TaxID=53362 RepID=A0ABV5M3H6_9ACTN|nr:hypothetical protein [Dactylosporangium vinaceum]UAB99684.1 hypothetical protein Dvina_17410 [Dactylosporangium vinaceum]